LRKLFRLVGEEGKEVVMAYVHLSVVLGHFFLMGTRGRAEEKVYKILLVTS